MARQEEARRLGLGLIDNVGIVHRNGDGRQIVLTEQAHHAGGDRHEGNIVLVLAPGTRSALLQNAGDLEGGPAEEDILADRAFNIVEQVAGRRCSKHHGPDAPVHIVGGEEGAVFQAALLGNRPVLGGSLDTAAIVIAADPQRCTARSRGNGCEHIVQLAERLNILQGQGGNGVAPHARARCARPHEQQVRAHGFKARHHFLLAALTDRQHGDHGGHANDHTQQGKRGAEEVRPQ